MQVTGQQITEVIYIRLQKQYKRPARVIILLTAMALLGISELSGAYAQFDGGDGTAESPYLVATAEHLDSVRDYLDAHFKQTAPIDLGAAPWNEGSGWSPVGNSSLPFTGTFDGAGYTIANLTINRAAQYQGLFGYTENAFIGNLHLENVNLQTSSYGGGLAGYAKDTQMENVSATGALVAFSSSYDIGGLVGEVYGGVIHNAAFSGHVRGDQYTGGLLGKLTYGELRYAYSLGTVVGTGNHTGGLIGYLGWSTVSDCYSRASVTGTDYVGGLAGSRSYYNLYRAYSTGAVSGSGSSVGGLLGYSNGGAVRHCYWDVQSSGQATSAGGADVVGCTTDQMTYPYEGPCYEEWDFEEVWAADADTVRNDGYRTSSTGRIPMKPIISRLSGTLTRATIIPSSRTWLRMMRRNRYCWRNSRAAARRETPIFSPHRAACAPWRRTWARVTPWATTLI